MVFAGIFALMSAFVVVVTVAAVRANYQRGTLTATAAGAGTAGGHATGAGHRPAGGRVTGPVLGRGRGGGSVDSEPHPVRAKLADQRLRAALKRIMAGHAGHLGVGVVNLTTGARAVRAGGRPFPTAGVGKVDLLAALLLRCQAERTGLSQVERNLAARAIEENDGTAVAALRRAAGGAAGLVRANVLLRLRHTAPARGRHQGLTRTTVRDQLRLLTDLASARSPLWPGSRSWALRLMSNVSSSRAWGITEAAAPGTQSAVENGARRTGPRRLWVVDSIGVIHYAGQVLEVAVVLDGQPSQLAGTDLDERAAVAAVAAVATAQR
jgi:hypothetical protein